MTRPVIPPVEDRPGFLVPGWSPGEGLGIVPVCLAPWRRATPDVGALIVASAPVGRRDVFVDLGSGDGSVVVDVVKRTGCFGVGVEAAGDLVDASYALAAGIEKRVLFLQESVGSRALGGATVVYSWLLEPAASVVRPLLLDAARSGSLRAAYLVGDLGPAVELDGGEVVGRVRSTAARSVSVGARGRGASRPAWWHGLLSRDAGVERGLEVAEVESQDWSDVTLFRFK